MEPRILQHAEQKLEAAGALIGKSQEEAAGQFESLLHEMSEVQYRDLMGRIEKGAGEAGAQAAAEVRNASETLVHQLSEKVDSAAARLQEQHEQSRSGFETSMKDSLEAFRKQLEKITRSGLEEQRKTISSSLDDLQKRLRTAAEMLASNEHPSE